MNRLKALGVQTWPSKDFVRGRLVVEPARFKFYPGTRIEADQGFVMYQHAFIAFPPPSPLTHLGGIRFFESPSRDALVKLLEDRWANLVEGTENALNYARHFRSDAALDLGSWMIETKVNDNFGAVTFRFDGRLANLFVHAVDDQALDPKDERGPISAALPEEQISVGDDDLIPLVRAARARLNVVVDQKRDAGPIELSLDSVDLGGMQRSVDLKARKSADIEAMSLDLDLDALKTGDISVNLDAELLESLDIVEPVVEAVEPAAAQRRHTRTTTNVAGKLHWPGGAADVIIADVSRSGAFARIVSHEAPPSGTTVFLTGVGKFAISATVAYVRPPEEAALFETGGGVGLNFDIEDEPTGVRRHQDAPVCAALTTDLDARRRLLIAFDEAGCVAVMVDNLVELAIVMAHLDVRLVVLDEAAAETTIDTMELEDRAVKVVALRPETIERITASAIRAQL